MTQTEIIKEVSKYYRITLEQLGYKPKAGKGYLSQNQALQLLNE